MRILIDGVAETAYISCGQLPVDDRNRKRKVAFEAEGSFQGEIHGLEKSQS